jgi:hypothetical protein
MVAWWWKDVDPLVGKETPILCSVKQKPQLLHLVDIMGRKKPYSLYASSDFNENLKAMQNQAIEKSYDEIPGLDEVDYEVLHSWIFMACETSVILAAISLMDTIGWPA